MLKKIDEAMGGLKEALHPLGVKVEKREKAVLLEGALTKRLGVERTLTPRGSTEQHISDERPVEAPTKGEKRSIYPMVRAGPL